MDYEYAKEKDIKELYDLQLRAFESEAEMIRFYDPDGNLIEVRTPK